MVDERLAERSLISCSSRGSLTAGLVPQRDEIHVLRRSFSDYLARNSAMYPTTPPFTALEKRVPNPAGVSERGYHLSR